LDNDDKFGAFILFAIVLCFSLMYVGMLLPPMAVVQYTRVSHGIGVVDCGLAANGVVYSYNTTSFFGNASITSLACNDSISLQMNLFLMINMNNNQQHYWVQNVADLIPTVNRRIYKLCFTSTILNWTGPYALNGSLLSGGGSIVEWRNGFYSIYSTAPDEILFPYYLNLFINVSRNLYGEPVVDFSYCDGARKVVFNEVTFLMKSNSSYFFVGGGICDAEFVLTGINNGKTVALLPRSDVDLSLLYLNRTTLSYLSVPHARNFGRTTAEEIINYYTSVRGESVEVACGNGTEEYLW
jgi:hypothetical protein